MSNERTDALLETYRAEALALFSVNQAGRAAAERVGALLQVLSLATLAAVVVTANVIALQAERPWYVQVGSLVVTMLGLWSAGSSWRDMIRSGEIARRHIGARLDAEAGSPSTE
jgi:ABC-type nickel/cobalt efflux system permease component RcnA